MIAGEDLPNVRKVIRCMFQDQAMYSGDYTIIDLPEDFDWPRVERFLDTLTEEEMETFAVGEHEDMCALAQRSEEGQYAHEAVDELFMLIGM